MNPVNRAKAATLREAATMLEAENGPNNHASTFLLERADHIENNPDPYTVALVREVLSHMHMFETLPFSDRNATAWSQRLIIELHRAGLEISRRGRR